MQSIDKYNSQLHSYIETLNKMATLEVTKCCGYSEFICLPIDVSIITVFDIIKNTFGSQNIHYLYVKNINNEILQIQSYSSPHITLHAIILQYPEFFHPVYPLPTKVVYRIFYRDDSKCNNCSSETPTNILNLV